MNDIEILRLLVAGPDAIAAEPIPFPEKVAKIRAVRIVAAIVKSNIPVCISEVLYLTEKLMKKPDDTKVIVQLFLSLFGIVDVAKLRAAFGPTGSDAIAFITVGIAAGFDQVPEFARA